MVCTVLVVIFTHNLAYGVIAGVFIEAVLFVRRVAHVVEVSGEIDEVTKTINYVVTGELFFASSNDLYYLFDYNTAASRVQIDFTLAHVWDGSSVAALDAIVHKYKMHGKSVEIFGLNKLSQNIHDKLSGNFPTAH